MINVIIGYGPSASIRTHNKRGGVVVLANR
jgi:hypothetical protein